MHAGGQRFDPAILHQNFVKNNNCLLFLEVNPKVYAKASRRVENGEIAYDIVRKNEDITSNIRTRGVVFILDFLV